VTDPKKNGWFKKGKLDGSDGVVAWCQCTVPREEDKRVRRGEGSVKFMVVHNVNNSVETCLL